MLNGLRLPSHTKTIKFDLVITKGSSHIKVPECCHTSVSQHNNYNL